MSLNPFCCNVGQTSLVALRRSESCFLSGLRVILSNQEHARTRFSGTSLHSMEKKKKPCSVPARSSTSLIRSINHFLQALRSQLHKMVRMSHPFWK